MFIPHPVCYNLNQKEQSTQSTVHRDRWNDHRRGGNHEVLSQKCWPTVTAASICMVVAYGLQVCTSLVQIQITQGLLDGDLRAFTIRIILLLLTWLAVVLCLIAETFFQGRAVRRMNNALRRDMAAGLLHKTHQEYHKQESGEYLSQFTNDVNQIEQMAWTPFFTIMGSAAQVVFGIVALASIHWLLLVISLVIALVMIFVPRLFSKRLGTVGTACAASQADGVSKIRICWQVTMCFASLARMNGLPAESMQPATAWSRPSTN